MADTLKPCPFCGETIPRMSMSEDRLHYWIFCRNCRSSGPLRPSKDMAIDAWNTRLQNMERNNNNG